MNTELGPFKLIKSKINPAEAVVYLQNLDIIKTDLLKTVYFEFFDSISKMWYSNLGLTQKSSNQIN